MEVPAQIKAAAKELIAMYGDSFDYLGRYEGADAYVYSPREDACIGFPSVYLWKDGRVDAVSGSVALHIIDLLVEDVDEVDVE